MRSILIGAALALSGSAVVAEIDILSVTFNCENNTRVPIAYFNAPDGSGAAAMMLDEGLIALRQQPSGSGIEYQSEGANGTYTLRSKGWDAVITFQPDGATAPEQVLFKDCTSR